VLASIPSPGSNALHLGPLTFRLYGLMIALGVLAAVWLLGRRLAARGLSADHAAGLAMWAVPAGVVGARMYHVITDWRSFQGRWLDAFKIWEGGLGILGGVIVGVGVGVLYMRRHGLDVALVLDLAAPAIPLGQAIGRWGNWFNQELFGRPTDLPWGLRIDQDQRPADYVLNETFHPTFLYESLWNIGVVFALLRLERTRRLGPGRLFSAYLAMYALGRLWIEAMRIDTATEIAGLRVNLWVYSVVLLGAVAVSLTGRRRDEDDRAAPEGSENDAAAEDDGDNPGHAEAEVDADLVSRGGADTTE
jgi:prolipoprotein diacylglyceryl transferase